MSNLLLIIHSYIPVDKQFNMKVVAFINMIKCFNLVNSTKYEVGHHVITFIMNFLAYNLKSEPNLKGIESYFLISNTNIGK